MSPRASGYGAGAPYGIPTAHIQPHWPSTQAEATGAFGYGTWGYLFDCNESAGPLVDRIAGTQLTANSSPTFGGIGPISGDRAVGFDSVDDRFVAGTNGLFDITTTGQFGLYLSWKMGALNGTDYLYSKRSGAVYHMAFLNGSGHVVLTCSDGTTAFTATIAVNHVDAAWHDLLLCVDRDGGQLLAVSDLGASSSVDISAALTISSASTFSLGGLNPNPGMCAFAAMASVDVAAIRANAAAVITNIRKYTGRG